MTGALGTFNFDFTYVQTEDTDWHAIHKHEESEVHIVHFKAEYVDFNCKL
jgi:hypothetical protein